MSHCSFETRTTLAAGGKGDVERGRAMLLFLVVSGQTTDGTQIKAKRRGVGSGIAQMHVAQCLGYCCQSRSVLAPNLHMLLI